MCCVLATADKPAKTIMYHVYFLKCSDGSSYVGCTNDLKDRINRHNSGQVDTTKNKLPVNLIRYFAVENEKIAFRLEKYLKTGSGRAFIKKHFSE